MPQVFDSPRDAGAAYTRWIKKTGYSSTTGRLYADRVRKYVQYLAEDPDEYAEALADDFGRDHAVRDFRTMLMTGEKHSVSTVEGYLSALGSFYDWLGLGKPRVPRSQPLRPDPKSLTERELTKVLRRAERRNVRDYTICLLMFYTAVRVGELAAIDTDDVFVSDRLGTLEVRHGKGGLARRIPISPDARGPLRRYLEWRRAEGYPEVGPLFYSQKRQRISTRRIQSMVATLAEQTGLELTPHVFRHTYARVFLASGGDIAQLQQILGHKQLTTTQVYTGSTEAMLAESMQRVRIDL